MRQSRHFPSPVAELACKMTDVGERGQKYNESDVAFKLSFLWLILRSWFVRSGQAKQA